MLVRDQEVALKRRPVLSFGRSLEPIRDALLRIRHLVQPRLEHSGIGAQGERTDLVVQFLPRGRVHCTRPNPRVRGAHLSSPCPGETLGCDPCSFLSQRRTSWRRGSSPTRRGRRALDGASLARVIRKDLLPAISQKSCRMWTGMPSTRRTEL